MKEINTGFSSHSHVHIAPNGKEAYMLAGSPTKFAALIKLELNTLDVKVLRESSSINIDSGYFSIPTEIPYPTTDGKVSHGNFYLPQVWYNCSHGRSHNTHISLGFTEELLIYGA